MEYTVANVTLDLLRPHPKNENYKTALLEDSDEYRMMKASIATDGLRHPLLVQSETNIVISGHTRLRIAKQLGWIEIPVRFLDLSDDEAENLLVADNLERAGKEQDLMRLARSVDRLVRKYDNRKEAYAQLSDLFNVQDRQLDRLRSLLKLVPPLQTLVSEEHIGLKAASAIAALDEDQQREVITYIAATGIAESKDWKLTEKEAGHIASKIRDKKAVQTPKPEPEPEREPDLVEWDNDTENTFTDDPAAPQQDLGTSDRVEVPETTFEPQTREEEKSAKTEQTIFKALTLLKRDTRAVERIMTQTAPLTQIAQELNIIEVKRELSLLKKSMREALNAL